MICEYCRKEHDGSYGSGRFCSASCRAAFTNKQRGKKSEETKKKIAESLHARAKTFTCSVCGKQFKRGEGYNSSRKVCSEECHNALFSNISKYVDYTSRVDLINRTKRENGTFKKSGQEDDVYAMLLKKYPDTVRQYTSEVYPFNCDFYVPSLDMYIEYNGTWTHGKHPYDPSSVSDNEILNIWKSKNTKYYDIAVYTWTDLDVRKVATAKANKLNYKVFWNIDEISEFVD